MIAIIDYGLGNLKSVKNALDRLQIDSIISGDPDVLKKSGGLILPGVGSANKGMRNLKNLKLDTVILDLLAKGKSLLGICLGMQLLFEFSEEGNTKCLGILKGQVKKFRKEPKVPQIGWNTVLFSDPKNAFFQQIENKSYFYYVNSYYCVPKDRSIIVGKSFYGESFASIIVKDNIVATQFHPEKSGKPGYQFLGNFIRRCI
jgi:glutamine amidotransferase